MRNPTRAQVIEKLTSSLNTARLQISAMLLLTALVTFATSAILLRLGLTEMALRYPVAVIVGYLAFLVFLRIWIWLQRTDRSTPDVDLGIDDETVFAFGDVPFLEGKSSAPVEETLFGGGGDFAGGGAGGTFAGVDKPMPVALSSSKSISSSASSTSSGSFGFDFDLDDGIALILVLIVLVLIFSALIYVVWIAPVLLAELIIDAAVVSALYKPVRNIERRHWLVTALKKTAIPALIILVLAFFAGIIMTAAVPEAATVGQFFSAIGE